MLGIARRLDADELHPEARDPGFQFAQHVLSSLVGIAAITLPFVLATSALFHGEIENSISAYYYLPIFYGDWFVGTLAFVGSLLLAFRGSRPRVALLSSVAGLLACGVALFPTDGWGPEDARILREWAQPIHLVSAGTFFLLLAYFCLFEFTAVKPDQQRGGEPTLQKRRRNAIYIASGCVILLALIATAIGLTGLGGGWFGGKFVFVFEAICLWAFGIAWITLGRFMNSALLDPQPSADPVAGQAPVARR